MTYYVPGLGEKDPDKVIRSLMQAHEKTATNTDDIATNTAAIAATNAAIAAAGYVVGPASSTANGFAQFDGLTGELLKDHAATINLTSEVSGTLPTANGGLGNTAGAWTTWTPTVTPQAGTFTTVGASGGYYVIGKLVHFSVTITITTVGTASGAMSIALPVGTAARIAAVPAVETVTTGRIGYGRILSGGTTIVSILQYDNASWITAGATVTLTGIYEQT